jgi:hypothetical protein
LEAALTGLSAAWIVAAAICATVFGLAFAIAPYSCEGGLPIYFWSGIAALVVLLASPFVLRTTVSTGMRIGLGLGFAVLGASAWIGGLFVAPIRIMCRLF